jgi:tetratricopeptide (TPR) repeat protein
MSLQPTDEGLTVQKLREAQRLEPDNFAIEEALMRIRITARDCEAILASQKNFPEQYSFLHSGQLLLAQALTCLGRYEEALKLRPKEFYQSSEILNSVWLALEIDIHVKKEEFIRAREKALILRGLSPNYPEAYYWSFLAEHNLKMPADGSAQKYLSLCRGLSLRQRREFDLDPFLCRRINEVEALQKKAVEATNS